jgi:hypothetical protein
VSSRFLRTCSRNYGKIPAESMQGNMQVEELELQIADLTANFRMRDQFSGELSNAQIYGTTGNEAKPNKKEERSQDVSSESNVKIAPVSL